MVDNTEKREVSNNVKAGLNIFVIIDKCICHNFKMYLSQLQNVFVFAQVSNEINAGLNEVDNVDVQVKPNSQSFIHLPNLQPVIYHLIYQDCPPTMASFFSGYSQLEARPTVSGSSTAPRCPC